MPFADHFLPEYEHEMHTTRTLLERVPMEKADWKPHPKSRSLGQLATHLAQLPGHGARIATLSEFDVSTGLKSMPPAPKTRDELLALFDENVSKTRLAVQSLGERDAVAPWTFRNGSQVIFSLPRAGAFRTLLMNHMIHHRGQLSVYLRLNDVPLPSIYGPTADS